MGPSPTIVNIKNSTDGVVRELDKSELSKEQIISALDYRYTHPKLKQLFFELTIKCNQHCRHCGSSCGDIIEKDRLSNREILDTLENLKSDLKSHGEKLPYIVVTGGEPMLRPGFLNLMDSIHNLGYNWGMTTNASLVTLELANYMKASGLKTIGVSLDGLRDNHEWLRQVRGCYDTAISGIDNLVYAGIHSVMATTMVYPRNINELPEIYRVVAGLGCDTWRPIVVDPIGRADTNQELVLTPSQVKYLLDYIAELRQNNIGKNMPRVIFSCNHYLGDEYNLKVRDWVYRCNSGTEVCSITYDGNIVGCLDIPRYPDLVQGNIRTENLYDTWINKFKQFRINRATLSNKCSQCKDRELCRGGGYHTWDLETNTPKICLTEQIRNL